MAVKVHPVFVSCLIVLITQHWTLSWAQKRARPAVADLEMLIANDSPSGLSNSETGGRGYENLVNLAETLKRLQELEKYVTHQARPRYGRSVPVEPLDQPDGSGVEQSSPDTKPRSPYRRRRSIAAQFS
ncbi:uncharacterized protein LOC129599432 [Paramacrobiotus metropolitanus]|uniref:uncharacterized protein LOC129599432 n=1 Tax=Paramacrobiotus metropolitanus TaxID=2943436 RepID=UPI002445A8AE|nr:uncharacterized protein LOC129599432 [Paramacrobiotus metropolitanus]